MKISWQDRLVWGVLVLVILGISFASAWSSFQKKNQKTSSVLPVLGKLADFRLMNSKDKPFGSEDLKGKVWIANFIFVHCAGPCPVMSANMAKIQKMLPENNDILLVSFTVDPERDTPPVLAKYAQEYGAKENRWYFLTGPPGEIRQLVRYGFKLNAEKVDPKKTDDVGDILHSTHFVLVDQVGRVRGYYDSEREGTLEKIVADAKNLLQEKTK